MLDEGTKTRSALQIADEIALLGAQLQTTASWDVSSVALNTLRETFDEALPVWADVVRNPAFDAQELARVRGILVANIARRKDQPPVVAHQTFARTLFGEDHPYGMPNEGTEESLGRLTPEDLRAFYKQHYVPGNAVLVVAGDLGEAEVREKIAPLLRDWGGRPPRPPVLRASAPSATKIFLVDKPGAPQSSIRLGSLGLHRKSPDYYKVMVMNHVLGGSFKRLFLNLREQKGWTYGVSSLFEARRTTGPWSIGGEFVAARTADSVAEILREIKLLRDADVTDEELRETKDEIIRAFPARFETTGELAGQHATLAVYDLPPDELATFTKKIAAVTKADVRKMAQKYLLPGRLAIVVVGDAKSNEPALRKLADVERRDVEGKPLAAR
jgi:zinc protease